MKRIIAAISPPFIKTGYRLFRYRSEWHKQYREIKIRKKQNQLITSQFDSKAHSLIVFIVPGADYKTGKARISGGIISIISIAEETGLLTEVHHAQTISCTMSGDHLLLKFNMFDNKTLIYRFDQLFTFFANLQSVIIHLPEYLVESFLKTLYLPQNEWVKTVAKLQINILNQNIQLMPSIKVIDSIKKITSKVTITTAHQKYCTAQYRDKYDTPLHKLSAWVTPEDYNFKQWSEKDNILVVSPDDHPQKESIIQEIKSSLNYEVIVIQNLTYKQFKELIARAKFSITFGEGLDGYFIEPVFCGTVAFAVYNEEFFTADYKGLPTLYSSFDILKQNIVKHISSLENADTYSTCNKELYDVCAKHYNFKTYQQNLRLFYEEKYTFP